MDNMHSGELYGCVLQQLYSGTKCSKRTVSDECQSTHGSISETIGINAVKNTSKECLVKHTNRIEAVNFNVLVMGCGDASCLKQDRNNLLMLCCKTSTVATSGVRWKLLFHGAMARRLGILVHRLCIPSSTRSHWRLCKFM